MVDMLSSFLTFPFVLAYALQECRGSQASQWGTDRIGRHLNSCPEVSSQCATTLSVSNEAALKTSVTAANNGGTSSYVQILQNITFTEAMQDNSALYIVEATIAIIGQGGMKELKRQGSSGNFYRIFWISGSSSKVHLENLKIANGGLGSGSGGGLHVVDGTITITSCIFSNNQAPNGGGLYLNGGTVTMTSCTVSNNDARGLGDAGGGLNIRGGLITMTSCTVSNNKAPNGAGLYLLDGTVTMTSCTVSGNEATQSYGGGLLTSGGTINMTFCSVSRNEAPGGGGGIYNQGKVSLTQQNVVDTPCGQGKYVTPQMLCLDCTAGRFQDTIDMGGCKACGIGTSSKLLGKSTCFGCVEGEYQDKTASTFCERCPAGRYGDALNRTSFEDCKKCDAGKWSLSGLRECYGCPLSDKVEMRCPDGAYCGSPGEGVLVNETRNLQGFFQIDNLTFVKCQVSANCPGVIVDSSGEALPQNITANQCPEGYRGLMCLKCEKNYTRQSDLCNKCGDPAGQIAIAFLKVIAGILMYSYLIYKTIKGQGSPEDEQSGIIKIALRQFQLFGIIASFPFSWTEEVNVMFNVISSVANAGTEAFSFDCLTDASFRTDAIMNLMVPVLILAFFWSLILLYFRSDIHFFGSMRTPIKMTNTFCVRYLTLSAIVIMIQLHPGLVRQVLAFFQCIPVQQLGKSFLAADIDITCGSPEHDSMLTSLAIPALLLYIIGIPLTAVILLFKNRHNLDEEETRETLGFLYANYHIPYWEVVIIGRLVVLATISVVYESRPSMQATLGLQTLFLSLIAHVLSEPFTSKSLNLVETYSLAASVLCLSCGSLLLDENVPKAWKDTATVMIILTLIIFCVYILYMLALARRRKKELQSLRNAREENIEMTSNPFHDVETAVTEHHIIQNLQYTSRELKKKLFKMLSSKKDHTISQETNSGELSLKM
eukprot:g705.t1